MKKEESPQKSYEFSRNPATERYIAFLNDIEGIRKRRNEIVLKHFNELLTCNIDYLEDKQALINRIISKDLVYPSAFLASSLGFNRSSWQQGYEKILSEVGMHKRPKYSTLRNMLLFEKLKWLIIRYYERKKRGARRWMQ
jgi:hypothetical protein